MRKELRGRAKHPMTSVFPLGFRPRPWLCGVLALVTGRANCIASMGICGR